MSIPESEYKLLSGVESHVGSGSYGLKLMYYRSPEKEARFRALCAIPYHELTEEQKKVRYLVPDADQLLRLIVKQDRMLDPEVKNGEMETKEKLRKCFEDAGLGPIFMQPIPNGYWPESDPWSVGDPWYDVTTELGHFTLGWRKRVISLSWKLTLLRAKGLKHVVPTGEEVFPQEDVTRFEHGIHAWGYEKLTEYLKALKAWSTT